MARKRSVWRLAQDLAAAFVLPALAASAASAQSAGSLVALHSAPSSSHVHPLNDTFDARPLLKAALERSPTIRRLVARLDASDVIVYLRLQFDVKTRTADLHLMPPLPAIRRVLIRVDAQNPIPERLKWLGHELQHAAEIASAPDVWDAAGLARLFARIGTLTKDGYETDAAVQAGNDVYREVFARTADEACRRPPHRSFEQP